MSVEALMTQAVTLRTPTGKTENALGEVTLTYDSLDTTMYLEPVSGREEVPDRFTPIGDWRGMGRASIEWSSWAQVVYGDHVLNVLAPARPAPNAMTGTISHIELDLQEVT